jgi:hypothetical protein
MAAGGLALRLAEWSRVEDRVFRQHRVGLYSLALATCYLIFMLTGYFRRLWITDEQGGGIAIDFVATWAAGHLALAGHAAAAYDLPTFRQEQLLAVVKVVGDYTWAYPPTYFLLAAPLALLGYSSSAVLWIAATFTAYLAAIRTIVPRWFAMAAAAASPFALWSAFTGQNGFLTAALIGGVLGLLERRPIVAGILLGLLTLKPQLGVVFPIVLILTGRWRVIAAATVTAAVLAALSYAVFGMEAWRGFFAAICSQSDLVLAKGAVPFTKQQSVHALVRFLGGADSLAWTLHLAVAGMAIAFTAWLWRRPVDYRLKAAAAGAAVLTTTPYLFLYDLPILSVPVVFLMSAGASYGFVPGERTAVAFLMVGMLLLSGSPVGVPLLAALWLLIVLRLRQGRAAAGRVAQRR